MTTTATDPAPLPIPPVVSKSEWRAARDLLLISEKSATRLLDAIAAARRRLPMFRVDDDYVFEGENGKGPLRALFAGRRQLIVYHFMYGPDWESPCPGCSRRVDDVGRLDHLNARDTTFVVVARAPYARLKDLQARKGWTVPFFSSAGSDFNVDMGATVAGDEEFGLSVFVQDDEGNVYCTYQTAGRGVEPAGFRQVLDLTPYGRQEDWEDSPAGWPQSPTYEWGSARDE
jgi:predicted dithiol-disulfide oxidoreductase (DUF899 family)